MSELEQLFVEEQEASLRLDQLLAQRFKGRYSRTYFQKLIEQHLVLINGVPAKKRIKPTVNDEIEIEFACDEAGDLEPEDIPLSILYEDADILVINKQAGLVVHPAPGNWTGTFVNALVYHCQGLMDFSEGIRPGIVHRLDKETSGVLIAAKNRWTQNHLIDAFAKREVKKGYLAITLGNPGERKIAAPIGRNPANRKKMAVLPTGKEAVTYIKPLTVKEKLSLLDIQIETGRTHQIRVHLNSVGTPVLGDALYGSKSSNEKFKADRQMLHASYLELIHPRSKEKMRFLAPLPPDFRHFLLDYYLDPQLT